MAEETEPLTLGVDLGGTKVETAMVDGAGRVIASERRPTDPDKGASAVIAAIASSAGPFLGKAHALGIGVAGQVDPKTGAVRFAPNLGWRDVPLQAELEKALGLPVVVVNDVRAATWGELVHGAGQGVQDLVCIFVGTGVGGGIVSGGRVIEGWTGAAGELGHVTVVAGGRKCRCPNSGCLEAYAGGWAIAERAREAVQRDPKAGKAIVETSESIEEIAGITVARAFHAGDPLARRLVEETGRYLAAAAVGILNVLNPSMLILGGGIIEGTVELIGMVEAGVRRQGLPAAVERVTVCKAALGNNSGVVGAAALARRKAAP